jgi:hypothetical protein
MSRGKSVLAETLITILGAALMFPSVARAQGRKDSAQDSYKVSAAMVNRIAARLASDLARKQYDVAQGYVKLYTQADCAKSYEIMKSCYANNPAAPYILPVVPSWPEEYFDPNTWGAFGETDEGNDVLYRLDPREAIVVFGVTPPPAKYFGIQTYVFSQEGSFDKSSEPYEFLETNFPNFLDFMFQTVPNEGDRVQSFSSLSNAINNFVIERQSGSSFGKLRFFIITPDQGMNGVVRRALRRLGIPAADVFTEQIPPLESYDGTAVVASPLGLEYQDTAFATVMRYARPDSETAADEWRAALPLAVLRVRVNARSNRPAKPYGPLVLDTRTANSEAYLGPAVNALATGVCKTWGYTPCPNQITLIDGQSQPISAVGPKCRATGMNCLADTQDTSYKFSPNLPIDNGQVYAILGTLPTNTGNATYVGLSVNDSTYLEGVQDIPDSTLDGTANNYDVPYSSKLFVYYFSRDCAHFESKTGGNCFQITDTMVPKGHPIKLVERAYLRPGTVRGPDSVNVLNPIVIQVWPGPATQ